MNSSLGVDIKLIDGVPNWSPRGADSFVPFKSKEYEKIVVDFEGKAWGHTGNGESAQIPTITHTDNDITISSVSGRQGMIVAPIDLTNVDRVYVNVKNAQGSQIKYTLLGFCDIGNSFSNAKIYFGNTGGTFTIQKNIHCFDTSNYTGLHYFFVRILSNASITLSKTIHTFSDAWD